MRNGEFSSIRSQAIAFFELCSSIPPASFGSEAATFSK